MRARRDEIAHELVAERFAACANIIPQIESIYWWEGKIEDGAETLVFLKLNDWLLHVARRSCSSHPYKLPENYQRSSKRKVAEYLQ